MKKSLFFFILIVFQAFIACNYPKDPRGTLQKIHKSRVVKAGITENKPWATFVNGQPTGVEVNIIKEIARKLGAKVIWEQGSEQKLMQALKDGEIDIIAAGLTDESPWKEDVGLTTTYYTDTIMIGVPGAVIKPEIDKLYIGVKDGTVMSRYVKNKGATPVRVSKLSEHDGPVAGSSFELRHLGMKVLMYEELNRENHVMAVIPGENAWLMKVEDFLANNKSLINKWIAQGIYE